MYEERKLFSDNIRFPEKINELISKLNNESYYYFIACVNSFQVYDKGNGTQTSLSFLRIKFLH